MKIKAFCFSRKCAPNSNSFKGILKEVKFTDTECPDCKSLLKFGKEKHHTRNVVRKERNLLESQRYI